MVLPSMFLSQRPASEHLPLPVFAEDACPGIDVHPDFAKLGACLLGCNEFLPNSPIYPSYVLRRDRGVLTIFEQPLHIRGLVCNCTEGGFNCILICYEILADFKNS